MGSLYLVPVPPPWWVCLTLERDAHRGLRGLKKTFLFAGMVSRQGAHDIFI